MCLIHLDGFQVVYIPFVLKIKFKFLVQFPEDHLPHPVLYSLIFYLRKFTAFAYYMIDRFISITT